MEHVPMIPEYDGTKLGSTRTVRDIFHTTEEFNDYIKKKTDEAIKKAVEEQQKKKKGFLFRIAWMFILSPFIFGLEYLLYLRITKLLE